MKVNFWQALGVVLIVVGLIFYIPTKCSSPTPVNSDPSLPAATQPSTLPGADTAASTQPA